MADLVFPQVLIDIIVIAVSPLFLNYTSNAVITYALKVSSITRLGKTSVGFTLISLTTTLPELTVAVIAATTGGAPLSIGSVLGSNIFNISCILGLAAVLLSTKVYLSKKPLVNGNNIIPTLARSELAV
jgi:cation:H+ antiporter